MVLGICCATVASFMAQGAAQTEYEKYLLQFVKYEAVTGSMLYTGGPEARPRTATFRLAHAGKYVIHRPGYEEWWNGLQKVTYWPAENKYAVSLGGDDRFSAAFGTRFLQSGGQAPSVSAARDGVFEGMAVTIFKLNGTAAYPSFDLLVAKRTNQPVAWRDYGNQATFTAEFVELQYYVKASAVAWVWIPPRGAVKRDLVQTGGGG